MIYQEIMDEYVEAVRSGTSQYDAFMIALERVKTMRFGYLRTDDDGHNYLVPEEEVKAFDLAIEQIEKAAEYDTRWYDLINRFNEIFGKFRIDGISDYKVVMP